MSRGDGLRIKYRFQFEAEQKDDRLIHPTDSCVAGLAYVRDTHHLVTRDIINLEFEGAKNGYRKAVMWPHIQWKWCIKVFRPDDFIEYGVFVVECDRPINDFNFEFAQTAKYHDQMLKHLFDGTPPATSGGNSEVWRLTDFMAEQIEAEIAHEFIGFLSR